MSKPITSPSVAWWRDEWVPAAQEDGVLPDESMRDAAYAIRWVRRTRASWASIPTGW
jgi:hypothetical protein